MNKQSNPLIPVLKSVLTHAAANKLTHVDPYEAHVQREAARPVLVDGDTARADAFVNEHKDQIVKYVQALRRHKQTMSKQAMNKQTKNYLLGAGLGTVAGTGVGTLTGSPYTGAALGGLLGLMAGHKYNQPQKFNQEIIEKQRQANEDNIKELNAHGESWTYWLSNLLNPAK